MAARLLFTRTNIGANVVFAPQTVYFMPRLIFTSQRNGLNFVTTPQTVISGPIKRVVAITLQQRDGTVLSNLSDINWCWSDERGSIVDTGTGATTDATGVLAINVNTGLPVGAVGFLEIDGSVSGKECSFYGPVMLS